MAIKKKKEKKILLIVYKGGIIINGDDKKRVAKLKAFLQTSFQTKYLIKLHYFSGIDVAPRRKELVLQKRKCVIL